MRIVNFISGRDLGGPKQSFVLYSEALSNLGHEVHSVVRKGASVKPMIESLNLPVHEINYSRVTQLLAASKVSKTLRAKLETIRPDLIFAHKQSDLELVRSALRDHVKIIGVVHWFSNKHIQHADELIAVSAKVKQFLVDNGYTKPIHIVPNMVKIISEPTYRDLPDVPLIGAMGLFKAIIAGKGQLKPYLYYLRWRLNLKNELTFRGWVSNAERDDFIDAIDIVVLPSRIETFGMVVIEAMARIKRVVATRCGGPEDIITHNQTGYLVNKQDPDSLAAQLEDVITHSESSNTVVLNAQKHIMRQYTMDVVSKQINKILQS